MTRRRSARRPALFIHGGAGTHGTVEHREQVRRSLRKIGKEAFQFLQTHSALESVVFVVQQLEDDPLFNAGTGSVLQRDGVARMSASVMDGATLRFAGVLNLERVKNPVLVAQALLSERETVLAGSGAQRFARSRGFGPWNPVTPSRRRQWRQAQAASPETVGAVALDREGQLAAATSTGGRAMVSPGRVSDSGMPVGNYAHARAAIACTGNGEEIMHEALAARLAQQVLDGISLHAAFAATFRELRRRAREVAAIGLDQAGRLVWATTVPVLYAAGFTVARRVETF